MSRKPIADRNLLEFGDDDSETPILHVDMDAFYASVELIERPELVGKPVIIGGRGGRGVVLSATYEARALGVHAAMPMSTACRMAPEAVVISPSHEKYATVSDGVMEIFRDITWQVEPLSLDEAFLDVSGAVRRMGSPLTIGELIRTRVQEEQGITCSVGIAANKFTAKLASTAIKPNGLLLVPPDHVVEFLHPLKVGALWGVGPKTEEQLHRLGLRKVRDVAYTPVETLRRVLGVSLGEHLHNISWGKDERPVHAESTERSISNETTFAYDLDDSEEVLTQVLELSSKVARRLREAGMVSLTIGLKIRFADFKTITRSKTLSEPIDGSQALFAEVKSLYEALHLQRTRIRLVGVRAEGLLPAELGWEQLDLFEDRANWKSAELAMDRAVNRFGKGAVKPARLVKPKAESE